jgi:hypothetical protein
VRAAYLAGGHATADAVDALDYFVSRDRRILGAVSTRGRLRVNLELPPGRCRFALEKLRPALRQLPRHAPLWRWPQPTRNGDNRS